MIIILFKALYRYGLFFFFRLNSRSAYLQIDEILGVILETRREQSNDIVNKYKVKHSEQ